MRTVAPDNILRGRGWVLAALVIGYHAALPAEDAAPAARTVISTSRPAPADTAIKPAGQLQVRVYEDLGPLGPVDASPGTPLAVDVAVGLVTCPDGNTEIGPMNIGGWRYDVARTCADANSRGIIAVPGAAPAPSAMAPVASTARAASAGQSVIRCDPATWRCVTASPAKPTLP